MASNIYAGSSNFIDSKFKIQDSHWQNILLIGLGVLTLALMAQIAIPLPFSPVPITGQSLGVLIVGSLFGAKRATYAALSYILLGAMGAPIFSMGAFGLARVLGPTGGYLLGFIIAAFLMGLFAEYKKDRSIKNALIGFTIGHFVIFTTGLIWLSFFVGVKNVLALGFYPFIPGLIIKTLLASIIIPTLWKTKQ